MLFICVIICVIFVGKSATIINCNEIIRPNSGDNIICDNNCLNCEIECTLSSQCKGTTIYSGALNTIIRCKGDNSCQEMKTFIGKTVYYPVGYNSNAFYRNEYNNINIDCSGKIGCLKSEIYIDGNFINGGKLNANGAGFDHFKDSFLSVKLHENQIFNLDCGLSNNNCGGSTEYLCYGGLCYCNNQLRGQLNGCNVINNGILVFTSNPTKLSLSPTMKPTQSPINNPTNHPTGTPTVKPSITPTKIPTSKPTSSPVVTISPTKSTKYPTNAPTLNGTNSDNNNNNNNNNIDNNSNNNNSSNIENMDSNNNNKFKKGSFRFTIMILSIACAIALILMGIYVFFIDGKSCKDTQFLEEFNANNKSKNDNHNIKYKIPNDSGYSITYANSNIHLD